MNLGVILPTTKLYGGVKRFLELGNIFIEMGHNFTVYTNEGVAPTWFDFKGETKTFAYLKLDKIDALFTTETGFVDLLVNSNAKRRIVYHVRIKEDLRPFLKHDNIEVFACSTNIHIHDKKKYKIDTFEAYGGINLANYHPKTDYSVNNRPFIVMAYGRLSQMVKGTRFIVRACESLYRSGYNIRMLLYDTAVDERAQKLIDNFKAKVPFDFVQNHPFDKNSELFNRADIFVSAEGHAGWANSVCEAMACALPVIATGAGSKDFLFDNETGLRTHRWSFLIRNKIKRLIKDRTLRERLGHNARRKIENFDWHELAKKIIIHLENT